MLVIPSGIIISVKFEHSSKAQYSIVCTLFGIVNDEMLFPENALSPIEVTLFGIVTLVNFEHDSNTFVPSDSIVSEIIIGETEENSVKISFPLLSNTLYSSSLIITICSLF